jgi:hypothetical protein
VTLTDAFHVTPTQQPATGEPPIAPGTIVDLADPPALYSPGAAAELGRLFPDGLTTHGSRYMAGFDPGAAPTWFLESFLEAVRRAEFPARLSRMQSLFAFESIADAKSFIGTYRDGQACAIYRVRGGIGHRANMSLLATNTGPGAIGFALARSYWLGEQGTRPPLWELLLRPPVEFVEIVEPIVH